VANVRYIVRDVDEALQFYCDRLGFKEEMHPAPVFAMIVRDDLRLLLSQPAPGGPGGGSQEMPDGTLPKPGGWTGSHLMSPIWPGWSRRYGRKEFISATTSSRASAVSRY
jgi:catechol 2,3-dioxygenase-like lactoylglutathione lyase family enzyme